MTQPQALPAPFLAALSPGESEKVLSRCWCCRGCAARAGADELLPPGLFPSRVPAGCAQIPFSRPQLRPPLLGGRSGAEALAEPALTPGFSFSASRTDPVPPVLSQLYFRTGRKAKGHRSHPASPLPKGARENPVKPLLP